MINKKVLLIAFAIGCLTFAQAKASSLVQMDIKKISDNSVDVTLYTSGSTANPMVTRKSDNKYVILMPNVAGKNAGVPDLSGVKDIITNVDIKNVDDGMSGYTKVTLITTKPLSIKTRMQKAVQLSSEEKEAKAIIAETKTHPKQTIAPTAPKKEVVKTIVTSNAKSGLLKSIEVKKVEKNQKIEKLKAEAIKAEAPKSIVSVAKSLVAPVEKNKIDVSSPEVKLESPVVVNKMDVNEIEKIEKISKSPANSTKIPFGWALLLLPIGGLFFLAKIIRNSVLMSKKLKDSFHENLAEKPHVPETFDEIINDGGLSWQERYQKFVQESKGEIKKPKYNFISEPLSDVDKKRLEFENTLIKTPTLYEEHKIDITNEPVGEVFSEDEAISDGIRLVKLKAFAKPVSLHVSQRNKVKKTLPKSKRMQEGKFMKLQETALNASSRRFTEPNLKVSDLIETSSKYLQNEDLEMVEKEQNYMLSSIDEYFSLLDKEQTKKMTNPNNDLSSKVAASLASVKPSMNMKKSRPGVSNPISRNSNSDLNGLVVKSGFNIDENRGFYIVNLDGTNALVGRIKNEVFVLKKFDTSVDKLQVRLDSENVYMVKAGDFKSLVDVDENKMGVLIEL